MEKPEVKFRTDSGDGDKRCFFEVRPDVELEDYLLNKGILIKKGKAGLRQ